jgi:SM-20-related protein
MNATAPAPDLLRPSREAQVDGRPIRVYDGLLPDVGRYVAGLSRAAFTRSEFARPETADYRHWAVEMPLEKLVHDPIFALTSRAVSAFCSPGIAYRAYRAYTNVASYGDMLFSHTDCLPDARELTALWYLCERWDVEWGGETMFFDASGDCIVAVTPRPGRLAVFDGAISHAGRPPNRVCFAPRYTFAIKFERVKVGPDDKPLPTD